MFRRHDEIPEAGDLHLLPTLETALHQLEDGFDDFGGFLLGAPDALVDALDEIRFGERRHRPSAPKLESKLAREVPTHLVLERVHFLVRERAIEGPVGDRVREALAPRLDRRAAIAIEQTYGFDQRLVERAHRVPDRVGCKVVVDHHGDVTRDGRKAREKPYPEAGGTILSDPLEVKLRYDDFRR